MFPGASPNRAESLRELCMLRGRQPSSQGRRPPLPPRWGHSASKGRARARAEARQWVYTYTRCSGTLAQASRSFRVFVTRQSGWLSGYCRPTQPAVLQPESLHVGIAPCLGLVSTAAPLSPHVADQEPGSQCRLNLRVETVSHWPRCAFGRSAVQKPS